MDERISLLPTGSSEEQVIKLWLKRKQSRHTRRTYRRHIDDYRLFIGKPAIDSTIMDLQSFLEYLQERTLNHNSERTLSRNSQKVAIDAVKSYLSFAYKTGFSRVNVGAAFGQIKAQETMSERCLSEYEVQSMILNEKNPRNAVMLRVLYGSGMRVAELCHMRWRDVTVQEGGQVKLSILGKREKRRHVLLNEETSRALLSLARAQEEDFIFKNDAYSTPHLTERAVQGIVKCAARNAGIKRWNDVSPHWLRHSHATHAIGRNAPLSLIKETLGHESIATTDIYIHVNPKDSSSRYLPHF